jgi:hypothetical protein
MAFSLGSPATAEAQEADRTAVRVLMHGVVHDELTRTPVAGAAVYLEERNYGTLTDSLGRFRFDDVAAGFEVLAVVQFGYEELSAAVEMLVDSVFVEIELTPRPILLDGVTTVADNISTMERRFRSRRRAVPFFARVYDQERMLRTASANALEFLRSQAFVRTVPCPALWTAWRCVRRRGRIVSPRVYVDEIPAIRGLDELESYPPSQIYQMEVFSYGAEIRAYTYGFMQRMAERPRALMPIGWQ